VVESVSDELREKKERARGYLEGYEDGLKEAWDDFMGLTTKGYQPREIRILAKSKILNIEKRVDTRRKEVESALGENLEEIPSVHEEKSNQVAEISPGGTYLIEELSPDRSFTTLRSLIEGGYRGLCISRIEPKKIEERYGVEANLIWLTKTEVPESAKKGMTQMDFMTLSPTGLDMLTTIIMNFLKEEGDKVILLGGMDYLMTYNEFSKILRLLQNMKDRVTYAGAIMLIPYDPSLLDEKDLRRLRSEIEERL
jgi:hypothetical protein